jgi:hypothetical protein
MNSCEDPHPAVVASALGVYYIGRFFLYLLDRIFFYLLVTIIIAAFFGGRVWRFKISYVPPEKPVELTIEDIRGY